MQTRTSTHPAVRGTQVCESKKRTWLSDATISHPRSLDVMSQHRVRVQNVTACTLGTGAAIETHWRQLENAGCVKQLKDSESPTHFVCFISRVIGLLMGRGPPKWLEWQLLCAPRLQHVSPPLSRGARMQVSGMSRQ